MSRPRTPPLLVLAWAIGAGAVDAQVIRGTVVDGSSGGAVPLAGVFLLDRSGSLVSQTMADTLGAFVLEAPAARSVAHRLHLRSQRTFPSFRDSSRGA